MLAQQKEGTIFYERKVNMHKTIQDEQMRAMMPEFRVSNHILLFSDSVSVYKLVPDDEAPDPFASGNGGSRIMIRSGSDGGNLYKNFTQAKSIQENEMGGKNFLIIDSIKQQPWKLGTDTKQILGYTCHKATRKITQPVAVLRMISMGGDGVQKDSTSQKKPKGKEVEVIAWYADAINSPVGPESFGQLPGVILQLDVNDGVTVYTAKEVKKTVDPKELKEPKKGKVVTREEYMKMMSDLMGGQGGQGNMRVRSF